MNDYERTPTAQTRQLLRGLRDLGDVKAPPSLLLDVLAGCCLIDSYSILDSPIGPVYLAFNDTGVSAVMRAQDNADFERMFRTRFGRGVRYVAQPPEALAHALSHQLSGVAQLGLRFDLRGVSEFERAVLMKALEIPHGEVRPYSWVAREIGRPGAVRAVGSALKKNPVPLLIPCHRVVLSDGHIGGYAFGTTAKHTVLEAEGTNPDLLEELASSGVRYFADPEDGMYCLPTCGKMHLRTNHSRLLFHTRREAIAAGFRPCETCRPALAS